jgi:hypothetical protein
MIDEQLHQSVAVIIIATSTTIASSRRAWHSSRNYHNQRVALAAGMHGLCLVGKRDDRPNYDDGPPCAPKDLAAGQMQVIR